MMARGSNSPRQPLSVKQPAEAAKQASAPAKPAAAPKARKTSKTFGLKPSQRAAPVAKSPKTKADKQRVAAVVLERLKAEYP
ncbi:MAG: hypothetical protein ACK55A_08695, partial [Gemmatimonas sp.]